MPGRGAQRRLPQPLRRLPALLLAGVFLLVTAGLPAVAAPHVHDSAADSRADTAGTPTLAAVHDLPGAIVKVGSVHDDPDLAAPPPCVGVDDVDLHLLAHERPTTGTGFCDHDRAAADPVRGPPATQRL